MMGILGTRASSAMAQKPTQCLHISVTISLHLITILQVKKNTRLHGKVSQLAAKQGSSLSSQAGKIISIVVGIAILASVGGYFYYSKVSSNPSTTTQQTQTAVVRRGDLVVSASGSGTLAAASSATFGFDTSGQVTQVNVKVGDQVEAGQVLAQLDNTLPQMKYEEAQQNLRELYSAKSIATIQQEIATAQDSEAAAKDWLAYLISPEVVAAEDNLAIAQQELATAEQQSKANPSDSANQLVMQKQKSVAYLNDVLTQAWIYYKDYYVITKFGEYDTVGKGRHRKQVLVMTTDPVTGKEVPVIDSSVAELATARNNVAQAQSTISQGQAYLNILNSGVIPDDAVGSRIKALYDAQLAVDNAKSDLDATELLAPISGTVTALNFNVGEQAGTTSTVTISQLSQPYTLDAYLDEQDWSMAKVGNKVNVTFDLLPEQTFTGTVTLVYPELESGFETSLVHIVVQLDKSISQTLPAGTKATVDVVGAEAKDAVLVPVSALHDIGGKYTVTILQNGQQMQREVEIGLKNGTYAEVKSGLEAREIVVTK